MPQRFLVPFIALLLSASAAFAQTVETPPYEKDLMRLSEVLGSLHYLRSLCGAEDGGAWREKMQAMMETEAGPPERKERLAGAFNAGFRAFQQTYKTCTPSARRAIQRYLDEGARLARESAVRYGN